MVLTHCLTQAGQRWFADDVALPRRLSFGPDTGVSGRAQTQLLSIGSMLGLSRARMLEELDAARTETTESPGMLAPIDEDLEVWAAGVTYLRSRDERQAESTVADVYGKVYDAARPELFFKAAGRRVVGHGAKIRIRRDSNWNVPEPELTLVVNCYGEIVGYTAGNDVSSRSIEGENPLYLPQAKTYDGSCALGPSIVLAQADELIDLPISCIIQRNGREVFVGTARTSQMKRRLPELVEYLMRETSFPRGVFLMTGTGIVPEPGFTLLPSDVVTIQVGELTLVNEVDQNP